MRGEKPRRKYPQGRAVQSIIGATDTRRSIVAADLSTEMPMFAEYSMRDASGLFRYRLHTRVPLARDQGFVLPRSAYLRHQPAIMEPPILPLLRPGTPRSMS